ncbi:reverse transcriptase domain, reverse transcriptase zinc-binding domain protein, partial [Tanacetum coccineum]
LPGLSFQWAWSRELRSTADHEELILLQNLLANLLLSTNPDTWVCSIDSSRIFSVKGMRKLISNSLNVSYPPTISWNNLVPKKPTISWNNLVPKKVNITSWRVVMQRMPTRSNLSNRDIDLDSVLCPICNEEIETEEHLFVKCEIAKKTWTEVLKWWNICNVRLENINDIFSLKNRVNFSPSTTKIFDAVIHSTIGILWRFRNYTTLAVKRPSKDLILNDVKQFTFSWICNRIKKAKCNWLEWLCNPCNSISFTCT